jgi:ABC-2 type transport system permease protein
MSAVRSSNGVGRGGSVRLVLHQIYYEQLSFWLSPVSAVFTLGFALIFLIALGLTSGDNHVRFLGNVREIQYYVPAFAAYGVMSTCFNTLAIALVIRREMGLLKRQRLSPIPTWAMIAGLSGSALLISALQVALLLGVGWVLFGVDPPGNVPALLLVLAVGSVAFTCLGLATSTLVPNQESAGPMISLLFFVLLFMSGLWYPMKAGSVLAEISSYFPIRHLITAMFAPFDPRHSVSAWAWKDLLVVAGWGVAGALVAARRWQWAPRRS